ncbi:MAG: hypothetical protein E6R07_12100 [Nevskiaceae bacterium]|nr:MAG: hypothetical protein E6R07_12100 [Nevskiaceae bacterium]
MQEHRNWPVGVSLRFAPEIAALPDCGHLAGTAVIVLSRPQLLQSPLGRDLAPELRQLVYSFAAAGEGWVLPSHLEALPPTLETEALRAPGRAMRRF